VNDEQKFWCTVWPALFLSVAVLVSALAWPIAWYNVTTMREAMERGYEEVQVQPGNTSTRWAKVSE
jgi:hypothetical protein